MSENDLKRTDIEDRVRQLEELVGFLIARSFQGDPVLGFSAGLSDIALRSTLNSVRNSLLHFPGWVGGSTLASASQGIDTDRLFSMLADQLGEIRAAASVQQARMDIFQREHLGLREQYALTLVQISRSEALADELLRRAVPMSVYLGITNREQGDQLFVALVTVLGIHGFDLLDLTDPVEASWFRKATIWTKEAVTSQEVKTRLAKVEESLELRHIEQIRAERDKTHSEALLNISKATEGQDRAAIVIGAVVMVKIPGPDGSSTMVARTLTSEQQRVLERNPALAMDPEGLHRLLNQPHSNDPEGDSPSATPQIGPPADHPTGD